MSSTPHDALFKHTFSQPQHAIELLRSVLPPAVVRHIDFDTLQVEPTSFIDEKLRARFSDLLFRVRLAGQPAYLYLLFEHQSGPERLMCLRLLRYVLDVWDDHLEKDPRSTHLPVVIPIVLHHGEHGWTQPVTLRDLYDAPPEVLDALRPYLIDLTFVLDDLAPQDDAAMRARALSAVPMTTLWAFRHVRRNRDVIPVLRKALDLLVEVVRAPNGIAALAVLLRYILEVSDSSPGDVQDLLHQFMLPEASETVMTAADHLRNEGRQQTQRENVLRLLTRRFGPLPEPVLARIRRAEFALLDRWFDRGIMAQHLDDVFADEP
jgi:predicted transposase/invertase (TIGR01784 family)